jgi:Flp pilus assembly protein TadD
LALAQAGEYSQAINEYEAVLRADPKNDSILCDMGVAYKNLGDRRNAHDAFDRACRLNPRNSRACRDARLTPVD